MNSIEFRFKKRSEDWRFDEVRVVIDGRDLVDPLREHEAPFAEAEGSPSIAGAYSGLSPRDVLLPSRHLYGEPELLFAYDRKAEVLSCAHCGQPGCWPLVCEIVVTDQTVTWQLFEQLRRTGEEGGPVWRYEDFGPFRFDRRRYDGALSLLSECAI